MEHRVYIGLGTNLGDKLMNIARAIELIKEIPETRLTGVSRLYCTSPMGPKDQDWFINAALSVDTRLGPLELLRELSAIESIMGRVRDIKWGPRTIDLDIIFYGKEVMDLPGLKIPHPEAHKRAFVMLPLKDIAAKEYHPLYRKTVEEIAGSLDVEDQKVICLGSIC